MNTKAMFAIVAGVVLVGGAAAWFVLRPNMQASNTSPEPEHAAQNTTESPKTPSVNMTEAAQVEVSIKDFKYTPSNITVKKGTTVIWTNEDSNEHNVVSNIDAPAGGPPKDGPLLGRRQQFTFTYDTVGTFGYHCSLHPFMTGQVTVVE
ncbi:MAG TPA: plastocyanin/azurin family copper-binding protein [Candidatus Saccharimonadales bacterium]|nr:plastocyanin/azurin family copper-binding protein [Candidatus Saccharimonadales bacterium]